MSKWREAGGDKFHTGKHEILSDSRNNWQPRRNEIKNIHKFVNEISYLFKNLAVLAETCRYFKS